MNLFIKDKLEEVFNFYREQRNDKDEFFYNVEVGHDGFDSDCYPESNLYELYVWDKKKKIIYHYHCEQWYDSRDDHRFYLIDEFSSKNSEKLSDFSKII